MTDDPTLYRYVGRGEFMAPDGTITKDPVAHAAATVSDEALWQALTRSLFASYDRLRAKSARSQIDHCPSMAEMSLCIASGSAVAAMASALAAMLAIAASSSTPRSTSSATTAAARMRSSGAASFGMARTEAPPPESGQGGAA